MSAADVAEAAALAEILRRRQAIIDRTRLVGGPRAMAFDLATVAGRILRVEVRAPGPVVQRTWELEEQRPVRRRRRAPADSPVQWSPER
jgi:hypothetical protein